MINAHAKYSKNWVVDNWKDKNFSNSVKNGLKYALTLGLSKALTATDDEYTLFCKNWYFFYILIIIVIIIIYINF